MKRKFLDYWEKNTKKLDYPYEYFINIEDYEKSIIELQKLGESAYYNMLNDNYPDWSEIDRTNEIIKIFKMRNAREITELYNKAAVTKLTDVYGKFLKVTQKECGFIPLLCQTTWLYKKLRIKKCWY